MCNIFKRKSIVIEQLAKTNAELEKTLRERNNENTTLNRNLQKMTEDRDYWKKEYEELILNTDTTTLELGKEFKFFYSQKFIEYAINSIEMDKLRKRVDSDDFYMDKEEAIDILIKLGEIRQFFSFMNEISNFVNKVINK